MRKAGTFFSRAAIFWKTWGSTHLSTIQLNYVYTIFSSEQILIQISLEHYHGWTNMSPSAGLYWHWSSAFWLSSSEVGKRWLATSPKLTPGISYDLSHTVCTRSHACSLCFYSQPLQLHDAGLFWTQKYVDNTPYCVIPAKYHGPAHSTPPSPRQTCSRCRSATLVHCIWMGLSPSPSVHLANKYAWEIDHPEVFI